MGVFWIAGLGFSVFAASRPCVTVTVQPGTVRIVHQFPFSRKQRDVMYGELASAQVVDPATAKATRIFTRGRASKSARVSISSNRIAARNAKRSARSSTTRFPAVQGASRTAQTGITTIEAKYTRINSSRIRQHNTSRRRRLMEKKRVGIVIYEEVEVSTSAGPFEVFSVTRLNEAKRREEPSPFQALLVAQKTGAVTATGGMQVLPHHTFGDCPPLDVLLVPGGWGFQERNQKRGPA